MIIDDGGVWAGWVQRRVGPPPREGAAMRAALLVDPTGLRVNEASATDNRYMTPGTAIDRDRAWAQHRGVVAALGRLGVPALTLPGREGEDDGIYPNNVFGSAPGRLIIGSMRHEVRRREARREDVRALARRQGWGIDDLSTRPCVAELTGVLIIDRARRLGFCGRSGRVDRAGMIAMNAAFGLRATFAFDLVEGEYHANMVLSILGGRAVILHAPSFASPDAAEAVAASFPGRALWLTDAEKAAFAGNCLAVTPEDVLFSQGALDALEGRSRATLEGWGYRLHGVEVDELEKGGGSLRCLIAEIY